MEYRVLGPLEAEFAFEPFAQVEIGRLEELRLAAVEERVEACHMLREGGEGRCVGAGPRRY